MASGGRSEHGIGYGLVVSASLLWATSGLLSRLAFDAGVVRPRTLAAIRVYGAALLLTPAVIAARPQLSRRDWLKVAAFGVFGVSLPQWMYFEAIARIPVTIALVIIYTAPVIVTVFERVAHHRVLPLPVYLAIATAVAGVIAAVTGGRGGAGALALMGILLSVGTAFAYAGQIAVAARQPAHVSPLVRTGLGMLAGSLFWTVFQPVWRLPFGVIDDRVDLGPRVAGSAPAGLLLAGIVVLGTVVPYTFLVSGTPRIGLGASSVTGMIEPAAAAVLAWIALDQRLTAIQVGGVVVALAAVTVAETRRRRSPTPELVFAVHDAGP